MYDFVRSKDKEFLMRMRSLCSDLTNQLVQYLNNNSELFVESNMVGSGAKNLETQNDNKPIDLDYNLVILDSGNICINDCKAIKRCVRKAFNEILKKNELDNCDESTSVLTTKKMHFPKGNQTQFSIDLAIIRESNDSWYRLIHDKKSNCYIWNEGLNSKGLVNKVEWIKKKGLWNKVRTTYLEKKNMYLRRGESDDHPSFNCYVEAVNEVYKANKNKNAC